MPKVDVDNVNEAEAPQPPAEVDQAPKAPQPPAEVDQAPKTPEPPAKPQESSEAQSQVLPDIQMQIMDNRQAIVSVEEFGSIEYHMRQLGEFPTPKLSMGLDKSVEEMVFKQSELVVHTLAKWQAEIGGEIQKLFKEISGARAAAAASEKALEAKIVAGDAAQGKAGRELFQQLSREMNSLTTRLDGTDSRADSLKEALQKTSDRLDASDKALSAQMKQQRDELVAHMADEVAILKQTSLKDMSKHTQSVEDALKQAEFERLRATMNLEKEAKDLQASVAASCKEMVQRAEAGITKNGTVIEDLKAQMNSKASATQAKQISDHVASVHELAASLQKKLTSAEDRLDSSTTALLAKFQTQHDTFEERVKVVIVGGAAGAAGTTGTAEDNKSLVDLVRQESADQIARLEESLTAAWKQNSEVADKLNKELGDLRTSLNAAQAGLVDQGEKAAATLGARLEPVSQAVNEVKHDLQALGAAQLQTETGLQQMRESLGDISQNRGAIDEAQRRLLEMEWYLSAERSMPTAGSCLSCGKRTPAGRDRSCSPHGSVSGSQRKPWNYGDSRNYGGNYSYRNDVFGDPMASPSVVGWSWSSQPHPPVSARPSSATYRRGGDAPDTFVDSRGMQAGPPAGPAISAARFQRKPMPTSSASTTLTTASGTVSFPSAGLSQ